MVAIALAAIELAESQQYQRALLLAALSRRRLELEVAATAAATKLWQLRQKHLEQLDDCLAAAAEVAGAGPAPIEEKYE